MKILFINNTKNLDNIGCRLTSLGLEILIQGNEVEDFLAESVFKINHRLNNSRSFKVLTAPISKSSRGYFSMVKNYILTNKKNLINSIDKNEIVFINGEGSIHHNRVTGIVLLAIASIAKDRGRVVCLANSTLQLLSPIQIKEIRRLDKVVVREIYSKHYLLGHGINSILGADAAWIFLQENFSQFRLLGQRGNNRQDRTLLTLGTLANHESARKLMDKYKLSKINADYLLVDDSDKKHLEFFDNDFGQIIDAKDVLKDPNLLIKSYKHIITGRHHIAIMAYFFGIPVTTLKANTYKIESTIFSIKNLVADNEIILTNDEISRAIELAKNNFYNI